MEHRAQEEPGAEHEAGGVDRRRAPVEQGPDQHEQERAGHEPRRAIAGPERQQTEQ